MKSSVFKSVFFALTYVSTAGMAVAQSGTPNDQQTETSGSEGYGDLFPAEISGVRFKMPKQECLDLLAVKGLGVQANSENSMFLVDFTGAAFSSIMLRFDSNAGPVLTEIEMRFPDETAAKAYAEAHFPVSKNEHPIFTDTSTDFFAASPSDTYRVKAWQFNNKIFFVAVMPNTRWSNQ